MGIEKCWDSGSRMKDAATRVMLGVTAGWVLVVGVMFGLA